MMIFMVTILHFVCAAVVLL